MTMPGQLEGRIRTRVSESSVGGHCGGLETTLPGARGKPEQLEDADRCP